MKTLQRRKTNGEIVNMLDESIDEPNLDVGERVRLAESMATRQSDEILIGVAISLVKDHTAVEADQIAEALQVSNRTSEDLTRIVEQIRQLQKLGEQVERHNETINASPKPVEQMSSEFMHAERARAERLKRFKAELDAESTIERKQLVNLKSRISARRNDLNRIDQILSNMPGRYQHPEAFAELKKQIADTVAATPVAQVKPEFRDGRGLQVTDVEAHEAAIGEHRRQLAAKRKQLQETDQNVREANKGFGERILNELRE